MEIKEVPLDQLKPDPANARKHSDRNIEEIIRSLKEFGQHAPLVVQKGQHKGCQRQKEELKVLEEV